jgi:hypothetical protein
VAQPPPQPPVNAAHQTGFTAGTGQQLMPAQPSQVITLPAMVPPVAVNNAPQSVTSLVAADAVQFSNVGVVTFPNIPWRNTTKNPAAPTVSAQAPYTVPILGLLVFHVWTNNGTPAIGFASNSSGVFVQGPFLGHDSYTIFQANVSAPVYGGSVAPGWVYGVLYIASGG